MLLDGLVLVLVGLATGKHIHIVLAVESMENRPKLDDLEAREASRANRHV